MKWLMPSILCVKSASCVKNVAWVKSTGGTRLPGEPIEVHRVQFFGTILISKMLGQYLPVTKSLSFSAS